MSVLIRRFLKREKEREKFTYMCVRKGERKARFYCVVLEFVDVIGSRWDAFF